MPLFAHAVLKSMLILCSFAKPAASFRRVSVFIDTHFARFGEDAQAEAELRSTDGAGQLQPEPQNTSDSLLGLLRKHKFRLFNIKDILQDKSQWPKDLSSCQFSFEGSSTTQALTEFLGNGKNAMVFAAGDDYAVRMLPYDEALSSDIKQAIVADMKQDLNTFEKIRNSPGPTTHILKAVTIEPDKCGGLLAMGMQRVHGETLRQYQQSSGGLGWTWRFVKDIIKETLFGICELHEAGVVDADRRIDNVMVEVAKPSDLEQRRLTKLTFVDMVDFSHEKSTRRLAPDLMTNLDADKEKGWQTREDYAKFIRCKEWLEGDEYSNQDEACQVAIQAPKKLEEFSGDEAPDSLSGLVAKNGYNIAKLEPLLQDKAQWPEYLKSCRFQIGGSMHALTQFLGARKNAMVFGVGANYEVKIYRHEIAHRQDIQIEMSALEKIRESRGPKTHLVQGVPIAPPQCGGLPAVGMQQRKGSTLAQYYQNNKLAWTWNFVKQIIQETLHGACELHQAHVIDYYRDPSNIVIEVENPRDLLQRQLTKLTFIHLKDMSSDPDNRALMPGFMTWLSVEDHWNSQADYDQLLKAKAWLEEFPDQSGACDVADRASSKLDAV